MQRKTEVPVPQDESASGRAGEFGRWTGFGGLRHEMAGFFDAFELGRWSDRSPLGTAVVRDGMALRPSVELTERDDSHAVRAELPGLDAPAIQAKLCNGVLVITGEQWEEMHGGTAGYHLGEGWWGRFGPAMRLPDKVDTDRIEAKFATGVLTVRLPKSQAALASGKTIAVKAA